MGNLSSTGRARSTLDEGKTALRIYNYLPSEIISDDYYPPMSVDYNKATTIRLKPVNYFMYGVLVKVEYLGSSDEVVIREDIVYSRTNNLANDRTMTITWIDEAGNDHASTKSRYKQYSENKEKIAELRRVRENIVDWLRGFVQGTPLEPLVQQLLEDLSNEVQDYLLSGSNVLVNSLGVHSAAWLDQALTGTPYTYRQYLQSEFTYGHMP